MVNRQYRRLIRPFLTSLGLAFFSFQTANAEDPGFVAAWDVTPAFDGKKDVRKSISGAACAPVSPPICVVALDEKRNTQFFTISDQKLVPGKVMRLLAKKRDGVSLGEVDTEGAAYADGYFYLSGSHGVSRTRCKLKPGSFSLFRFPVDPKTGQPTYKISAKMIASEIDRTSRLQDTIREAGGAIGEYAEQCLSDGDGGANLEGLAVIGERMYLGFRGPSVDGTAFILDVDTNNVFGKGEIDPKTIEVNLGQDIGIRDLAAVSDGLLILAGPVQKKGGYAIHHLNLATMDLRKLQDLTMPKPKVKAETVLLLAEQDASYHLLVMYDGALDGGPREYLIDK
ncbi:MAG: DUF3616 domain-containing protein [Roseibium sp.]